MAWRQSGFTEIEKPGASKTLRCGQFVDRGGSEIFEGKQFERGRFAKVEPFDVRTAGRAEISAVRSIGFRFDRGQSSRLFAVDAGLI